MPAGFALSAVRHNGVVIASSSDFEFQAFGPASQVLPGAPDDTDIILAPPEKNEDPTMVFVDGKLHLCSAYEYYICVEEGTLLRPDLHPFENCLQHHGRSGTEGVLNFGHRAARAKLGELGFEIHPAPPLGRQSFERMLFELTRQASQLLFDCGGPTSVGFLRSRAREAEALYPLFRFIRYAMCEAPPDERIGTCFAQISYTPHNRTYRERVFMDVHSGREITPASLVGLACRPEALTVLHERSRLAHSAVGRRLSSGGRSLFPERMVGDRIRTSFDTPENRFIKHFLQLVLDNLDMMAGAFLAEDGFISETNRHEARKLAEEIRRYRKSDFLRNVGRLSHFPAQSQVLRKRTGYRELTRLYHLLFLASQLGWSELALIENRRIDVLYEYWVFFTIVGILRKMYGRRRDMAVKSLSSVKSGLLLDLGRQGQVSLSFRGVEGGYPGARLSFYRPFEPGRDSYSVGFQPAICLETDNSRLLVVELSYDARWLPAVDNELSASKEQMLTRLHGLRDALGCSCAIHIGPDVTPDFFSADRADRDFPVVDDRAGGGNVDAARDVDASCDVDAARDVDGVARAFNGCMPTGLTGVGLLPLKPDSVSDRERLEGFIAAFCSQERL